MSTASPPADRIVRHPLVPRLLEVVRVERPTPRLVRVTLGGEAIAGFATLSPTDHVKLLVPSGGEPPAMPTAGPNGLSFPPGTSMSDARDYTPRRFDPETGELAIDVVIHGSGRVSNWAETAKPGDRIGVLGPRGSFLVPEAFAWLLLVGDDTALPTIARWLEALPAGARAFAVVEVEDAAEEQALATPAGATVVWVHRAGSAGAADERLAAAVANLDLPEGDGFAWIGGEVNAARMVRRHLLNEREMPRAAVDLSGHWKRGVASWDHHEEIPD